MMEEDTEEVTVAMEDMVAEENGEEEVDTVLEATKTGFCMWF